MGDNKSRRDISCDLDLENGLPTFLTLNLSEYSWRKSVDPEASLFRFNANLEYGHMTRISPRITTFSSLAGKVSREEQET